jgi:release factor glutamine methyltransferase
MTIAKESWTLGRLLDWTAKHLAEKGSEFPRLDAEVLLAHAQGCRRIELYTRYAEEAEEEVRARFRDLIRRRVEGCPVAYLVGRKEFFSLELEVGPAVLIPRPDTETLVMEALALAKEIESPTIVDVGAGSGAIAIAIAKNCPKAKVTAIDKSADALAVAQRNAAKHGVAERISFLEGDLLSALPADASFDVIASNPPYIATEDWEKLPIGVRQYEPKLALDGGAGGYLVIERLLAQTLGHLRPGGHILFEIGAPQEDTVRAMVGKYVEFELAPTIKDFSGHPRVVKARRTAK